MSLPTDFGPDSGGRIKGVCIVKPIVYGNIARYFGKKREEDGHTHQWTVYVKPYYNEDMSAYVKKVHFKLHESYSNQNRIVVKPPYEITETGWGEFEIVIKIHFHDPNERPVTMYHILKLFHSAGTSELGGSMDQSKGIVSEFYDEIVFQDPTQLMHHLLTNIKQLTSSNWEHHTNFEEKKKETLKSIKDAKQKVRMEVMVYKNRLKLARETIAQFKEEIAKVQENQFVAPCDRNVKDVELIVIRLRRVEQLYKLPNSVLQQLALCGYYEDLEKGVTLFRQGDTGKCWYAVMAGTLDVRYTHPESETKLPVTLCTLGVGATFGESILQDLPRDTTVVTQTTCELLRVEQQDFRLIYEKNKELMSDLVSSCKLKNGFGPGGNSKSPMHRPKSPPTSRKTLSPDQPNAAEPITESPSSTTGRIGWCLRTLLLSQNTCLKDRKVSGKLVRKCAPGTELVDWLLSLSPVIHTRIQATGMWQALLEEGVISHVSKEQPFKDKCFLYRFWQDEEGGALPTLEDTNTAEEQLQESLTVLIQRGPDAMLRMILRKPHHERTADDLETIFEELLHIRALSQISNSVKRELASVIVFEAHPRAGSVLFHQGDEGRSWYIILRGSVDVVIHGKGTVTTLQEADDFGKLALINDAPRAATIVLRENNCHFLRVDKDNFNRILRDVEANTVRLKEHGKDVLILEKISPQQKQAFSNFKYTVMAGTPQKMLEHLLETRLDGRGAFGGGDNFILTSAQDPFLDDFLLTHVVFLPTHQLVDELANHYRIESPNQDHEFLVACKKRVVQFVYRWVTTIRQPLFDDENCVEFLEDLAGEVENDCIQFSALQEEASLIHHVLTQLRRYQDDRKAHSGQKWKLPPCGQPISLFSGSKESRTIIMPQDDIIFRVYCADHTYCTLRLPVDSTAETIKFCSADKLKLRPNDELLLVEVKSNGERVTFKDNDISIPTALSINGRIFVSPKDHLDALTCLTEQEECTQGIDADLELFSTKELAYYMTLFDWDLFWCVHEYELLYHTFGRHHFGQITANLDVFLRRFNELQFWVITEICMTSSLSKRVAVLRKFIKLATYCKEYQNLNAFCAIVMGLSNMAISRLSLTWEKLPSKFRKLYTEFESLIDPSRNHRSYRVSVSKLQPPIVPFMPLLLKDMTFTHEGNKTSLDGLVNFEKMHMLAQTLRTIRFCRSRHLDPPSPKSEGEIKTYISCLRVIDNQRVLTGMSQKLEPRRS